MSKYIDGLQNWLAKALGVVVHSTSIVARTALAFSLLISSYAVVVAQEREENLFAAPLLNAMSIRNYDCVVGTESVFLPPQARRSDDEGYTVLCQERVIADYDKGYYVYLVKRRFEACNPAKPPQLFQKLPFEVGRCVEFRDGKVVFPITKQKFSSLTECCRKLRAPFMDLSCVNGHPYTFFDQTRDEHIQKVLHDPMQKINVQPNGFLSCRIERGELYDTVVADPSTLMISRFVRKSEKDGDDAAFATDKRYKYRTLKNIHLLVECNFENAASPLNLYKEIGTTQITWRSLNTEKLEFPPISEQSLSQPTLDKLLSPDKK